MRKSAGATSRFIAPRASGARKSMATLRLPLFKDKNRTDSSPSRSVPCTRYGSPGGTSTFTTSAPSVASTAVVCDPATKRVRSRTRSPASGAVTATSPRPRLPKLSVDRSEDVRHLSERRVGAGRVDERRHDVAAFAGARLDGAHRRRVRRVVPGGDALAGALDLPLDHAGIELEGLKPGAVDVGGVVVDE